MAAQVRVCRCCSRPSVVPIATYPQVRGRPDEESRFVSGSVAGRQIKDEHVVEMTDAELADYKAWGANGAGGGAVPAPTTALVPIGERSVEGPPATRSSFV